MMSAVKKKTFIFFSLQNRQYPPTLSLHPKLKELKNQKNKTRKSESFSQIINRQREREREREREPLDKEKE